MEIMKDSAVSFETPYMYMSEIMPALQHLNLETLENFVESTLSETSDESYFTCIESFNCSKFLDSKIETSKDSLDEICSNSILEHTSMDEVSSSSNIREFDDFNVSSSKLTEFKGFEENFSESSGYMTFDSSLNEHSKSYKDEKFQDSVNFFNDPSSLSFLENTRNNTPSVAFKIRNSLYEKFDPLYIKYFSEHNVTSSEQHITIEEERNQEKEQTDSTSISKNVQSGELNNPHLRQSIGNILISLDSPKQHKNICSDFGNITHSDSQKLYTEKDFKQALVNQELKIRGSFIRKEKYLEEFFSKKIQKLETNLKEQKSLCFTLYQIVKETMHLMNVLYDKKQLLQLKLENADKIKVEIKDLLDTSVNDFRVKEYNLSDFFREIDQNKHRLELYLKKVNMKQLEKMNTELSVEENRYKEFKCRSLEVMEKVGNAT